MLQAFSLITDFLTPSTNSYINHLHQAPEEIGTMTILNVAKLGNPVLRQKAEPVTTEELLTGDVQRLIDNMVDTMREEAGVGLAAPQVHTPKRIFTLEIKSSNPRYAIDDEVPLLVVVNPQITFRTEDPADGWESCLSIPEMRGVVPRRTSLVLRGLDRKGEEIEIEASDFFARVIQHETDHLDGIVFLDRMRNLSTLTHQHEFFKYWVKE